MAAFGDATLVTLVTLAAAFGEEVVAFLSCYADFLGSVGDHFLAGTILELFGNVTF